MHRCLYVPSDGSPPREVRWVHESIAAILGGPLTFVGTIDDLDVVAVGLVDNDSLPVNERCQSVCHARGPVVFVGTDEEGEASDIDVTSVLQRLEGIGA